MKHLQDNMETSTNPQSGVSGRWRKAPLAAGVIVSGLLLSGCASMDRIVCYGAGTCDRDPRYAYQPTQSVPNTQTQVIITSSGNYLVTRDSSGSINAIIQTSKGK